MSRLINPWEQFTDENGDPYFNGKVYFGLPNQDPVADPKAPFSDRSLLVAIGATQTLDARGMFQTAIFWDGAYSMSLFDSVGDFIRTEPEIFGNEETQEIINSSTTRSFDTVSDMVAAVDLVAGQNISVADYATGNNSGVLFFKVVASGIGTADGGAYIDLPNTTPASQAKQNFPSRISIKMYGAAESNSAADNTNAIHSLLAFNSESMHIPNGTFDYTNIVFDGDDPVTITGESRLGAVLNCTATTGIGIHFPGTSRCVLEKFSAIGGLVPVNMQIDSVGGTKYPFTFSMSDVEVKLSTATDSIAFWCEGVSHMQVQNCIFGAADGTGMVVNADSFNTGVYAFINCFFNAKTGKYGVDFRDGSALDSFAFAACYFAGYISAEKVGDSTNNVTGLSHMSCHYENNLNEGVATATGSSLVELNGAPGLGCKSSSWQNCTYGGFGVCESAFNIPAGYHFGLSLIDNTYQNILDTTGYVIKDDSSALFKDCEIKSIRLVSSTPNTFLTNNFRRDGGWTGGWVIKDEGWTDLQKTLKMTGIQTYNDDVAASSAGMPTDSVYFSLLKGLTAVREVPMQFRATTAELVDITDTVNTANKLKGRTVFNTDTNLPLWAASSVDSGAWLDATGATAHTPV